jgi:surface antigen
MHVIGPRKTKTNSRRAEKGQMTRLRVAGRRPAVGSVAWWPDSSAHFGGHVAYVEKVNSPTSIIISEMNYDGDNGFRVSTITSSSANWPAAFIHIHDR